jgi:hypothetical protein
MVEFFRKYFETKELEKQAMEHLKPNGDEERIEGRIIKISDRGYAFIISKDIPFTRIFMHWTALNKDTLHFTELKKGMIVEFTPQETEKHGWRAIRVDVLKDR